MAGYLGVEIFLPVAVVGLIVLALVALGANRRETDRGGHRPYALYLGVVTFFALFTVVFAGSLAVTAFASIPLDDRSSSDCFVSEFGEETCVSGSDFQSTSSFPSATDEHVRVGAEDALVALAAALVLVFHLRRMNELTAGPDFAESPARPTITGFAYAVCFVAMITMLVEGSITGLSALKVIAPGTFGTGPDSGLERNDAVVALIGAAVPALVSYGIFRWQWKRAAAMRSD